MAALHSCPKVQAAGGRGPHTEQPAPLCRKSRILLLPAMRPAPTCRLLAEALHM